MPGAGEVQWNGYTLHATVCAACVSENEQQSIDWKEFGEQKSITPAKYRVQGSLNAPLPTRFAVWASTLYLEQATYFQID